MPASLNSQNGEHTPYHYNSGHNKNNSNSGAGYSYSPAGKSGGKISASVQRAKSFSDILSVPRVETAFVGDAALTVYHGITR